MKAHDFDLLCAALAFTAVAMKNDGLKADTAQRATGLAYLIKEFCRATVPEAFEDIKAKNIPPDNKPTPLDLMVTTIARIMRENDSCAPQDLASKGFTSQEIERYWVMAKALAHVELNLMDS